MAMAEIEATGGVGFLRRHQHCRPLPRTSDLLDPADNDPANVRMHPVLLLKADQMPSSDHLALTRSAQGDG